MTVPLARRLFPRRHQMDIRLDKIPSPIIPCPLPCHQSRHCSPLHLSPKSRSQISRQVTVRFTGSTAAPEVPISDSQAKNPNVHMDHSDVVAALRERLPISGRGVEGRGFTLTSFHQPFQVIRSTLEPKPIAYDQAKHELHLEGIVTHVRTLAAAIPKCSCSCMTHKIKD